METAQFEALIELAVERETEANQFYHDVAAIMDNEEIKKIFSDLEKEELSHKNLLEEYKNIPNMALKFRESPDYKVAETVDLPALTLKMKPVQAIALAMKKEQQAVEFYTDLAERSIDQAIRAACLELAKMETAHKAHLESIYTQIAVVEKF